MPYTKETVDLYAFALGYGGFFLFPITSEWDAPQLYLITDRRIIRFLSSTVGVLLRLRIAETEERLWDRTFFILFLLLSIDSLESFYFIF